LKSKSKISSLILLSVIVSIIFGFVTYRQLKVGDYGDHIDWARNLADRGYVYIPSHSLFEQLTVAVRALIPFSVFAKGSKLLRQIIDIKSFEIAAVVVTVLSYIAVALLIFTRLSKKWEADGKRISLWFVGMITVAAMLVGPIFLFTLPDRMYLGYITGNPFHNPTQLLLRPLALLLFYHAYNNLYARRNLGNILIAAVLVVAATQAKSNFTLTFLPSLAILGLIQFRKLKELNFLYIIFGLGIPAVITLAAQYFISFTGDRVDSIIFAPFKAILLFVPNLWVLLLFTLLSILFPLFVTLFYWQQARLNLRLKLAWINLFVAFVMAMLFSQVINMASLNFWWGLSIGLFILFVESVALAGSNEMFSFRGSTRKVRQFIGVAIFSLHLLCGIIFYFQSILYPSVNL
jgi:hypothetical protein